MCLEIIESFLVEVNDAFISEINKKAAVVREVAPGVSDALADLQEIHFERTREIALRSLLAGVAMGRGLGAFMPDRANNEGVRR